MRESIHIWELPTDKIYIQLKEDFRKEFFDKAYILTNSWNKLGKLVKVKRGDTIIARNWRKNDCCFPLDFALDICRLTNISVYNLEVNLSLIKCKTKLNGRGGSSGKPIVNPKFPIKIDDNFCEILGHICGDGGIVITSKKGISLRYTNSEPKLIHSFISLVNEVFGDVKPNISVRNERPKYRRPNYQLQYPTILSLVVLSVFDCKPNDGKDVPLFILSSSEGMKQSFLRALFDDEGTVSVDKKNVTIGVKPMLFIGHIRDLLLSLRFNPTKIHTQRDLSLRRISVSKQEDIIRFYEKIGFKHPKKNDRLNSIIKTGWKFKRFAIGEAKQNIISMLRMRKSMSTRELSQNLNRNKTTVNEHLSNLRDENIVFVRKSGNDNIWSLNNGWQ